MSDVIRIQYQPLIRKIYAGRLDKARDLFLDKQDVTDDVLISVAEWVLGNHDGEASLSNGITRMQIKVLGDGEA